MTHINVDTYQFCHQFAQTSHSQGGESDRHLNDITQVSAIGRDSNI